MDFDTYQARAAETNQLPPSGPQNAVAPMLGLASETGAILNVYKKFLRDKIDLNANSEYLEEELGDLLWYTAAIATAFGLSLSDIAEKNLDRTHDYFMPSEGLAEQLQDMPVLDAGFPAHERLPRRLTFSFVDEQHGGTSVAQVRVIAAEPYEFTAGTEDFQGKTVGFDLGARLGSALTDNSRRSDGYRFHDAIHIGFTAVLGWSPVMRKMLNLKRRSDAATDDAEDGARAIFAEEGLATMLSKLAVRRLFFETELSVDMETIAVAKAVISDLECAELPAWLWRRAINQAFVALHRLEQHQGGTLVADLDARTVSFQLHESEGDQS